MKFNPLSDERIIYEKNDWKLTIVISLNLLFIYKANYDKNMYTCRATYDNHIHGEINVGDLPSEMQEYLLKEMI